MSFFMREAFNCVSVFLASFSTLHTHTYICRHDEDENCIAAVVLLLLGFCVYVCVFFCSSLRSTFFVFVEGELFIVAYFIF